MATTKKSTVKKTVATKKPAAKKTPAKARSTKQNVSPIFVSFRSAPETEKFLSFRFTKQSGYWLILSAVVLSLGLWVLQLHLQVTEIYDSIELNESINTVQVPRS